MLKQSVARVVLQCSHLFRGALRAYVFTTRVKIMFLFWWPFQYCDEKTQLYDKSCTAATQPFTLGSQFYKEGSVGF